MKINRQVLCLLLFIGVFLLVIPQVYAASSGCTTQDCHQGIMDIVPEELQMMQTIKMNGQQHGDPDGCVISHGGNPKATKKEEASRRRIKENPLPVSRCRLARLAVTIGVASGAVVPPGG